MQIAPNTTTPVSSVNVHSSATTATFTDRVAPSMGEPLSHYQIIRRNGAVVAFEPSKVAIAMMKAFLAVHGTQGAASASVREVVEDLTQAVVRALMRSRPGGGTFHIEDVQDQVELGLMRGGHHEIARAYVLYREKRTQERQRQAAPEVPIHPALHVIDGGQRIPLNMDKLSGLITHACANLGTDIRPDPILAETLRNLYDGVSLDEVHKASILAARTLIEKDPDYTYATARLLLHTIAKEVLGQHVDPTEMGSHYAEYFPGLQTLYDRYFIHSGDTRFELPQVFFMRVAMGLASREANREERAIEFYNLISSFDYMTSTPQLFNSGTLRPQLSSCFLTTVPDDLFGIYSAIRDNAMLSKWAGGLGNDWTPVRALGAHITGTNGKSQGVVPFLKVVNDTAVAVNQGGKRKGAVCAYLETWHLDIEEFIELRKNTGDDRRRTHDMNTANWIPDLFMKRVFEDGDWTLFSPNNVPDLHDLHGRAFEAAYVEYERLAAQSR
jgi:ribonucleoside-diphosphate reductase alpha chain